MRGSIVRPAVLLLFVGALAGCRGGGTEGGAALIPPASRHAAQNTHAVHAGRLGSILNSKNGGQIFGFDIEQNGTTGALAEAQDVETFDENTGAITGQFDVSNSPSSTFSFDGVFAGNVGLITHYVVPQGQIYAKRFYETVVPLNAQKVTGKWTPPISDVDVQQVGVNQTTSTSVLFAIELQNQDVPDLFVVDVAKNKNLKTIHLDPNKFGLFDGPQMGQYISANEGVLAYSPDGGTVGGDAPLNVLVNLTTGNLTQFVGYNNGFFHAGYVNGLAVDSATGVAATDTELNAQVEFYNLKTQTGITFAQLPCTSNTDQTFSGSGIAADTIHHLFLVTETYDACDNGGDSAIVVFDEKGNVVETITGFKFAIGEGAPAINPGKRMGWAFGPQFSQLQQFFY